MFDGICPIQSTNRLNTIKGYVDASGTKDFYELQKISDLLALGTFVSTFVGRSLSGYRCHLDLSHVSMRLMTQSI